MADIAQINQRLLEIKAVVAQEFPPSQAEAVEMCTALRDHVLKIHDLELKAVEAMQQAMA